ncbi:universal stress protein [Nocardia pseudovaccinii]|uniref:universal stress protein n=1 Tax=Nocardia pseudovaccinii TaxID=189540 RepID=UPI001FE1762E|nr:universal stress protein [Nocardia pseudovaccinii]
MAELTQPRREQREDTRIPVIVVGFDASPSAEHALAYAVGVACRLHATLHVIHVNELTATASISAVATVGVTPSPHSPPPTLTPRPQRSSTASL